MQLAVSHIEERRRAMSVYQFDPLSDSRWEPFVATHPDGSIFHTSAWLAALRDTYGYKSLVLTTTPPRKPLENGVVFCLVDSWLTGSRLVSLPFADHCQPLVNDASELDTLLQFTRERFTRDRLRYIELRPLTRAPLSSDTPEDFTRSARFAFHLLDVRPDPETLMHSFHRTSVREAIRRAKRKGITVESGRSEALLQALYDIRLVTRRRQKLPPQPMTWYRNLVRRFGDNSTVWVAMFEGKPIAALFTIAYKQTLVFKHGGSDERFNHLGSTPYVYWHAIQYAKSIGATTIDFGRSDLATPGLILFKDHWGAAKSALTYYRLSKNAGMPLVYGSKAEFAKRIFSALPPSWLSTAGRLLYRHIG